MFIHRVLLWPAADKFNALRDALLAGGGPGDVPRVVGQRIWGVEPVFAINRFFENLAALEEWRKNWKPDPATAQTFGRPPSSELWEVPNPPSPVPGAKYTSRSTYFPAMGKYDDVRALVDERAKAVTAAGFPANVWLRVSGGPQSLALVFVHPSQAAIEQTRTAIMASPATAAYAQSLATLLATPLAMPDIFELLSSPA